MVPYDSCFTLIGDAYCFDGFGRVTLLLEGLYRTFNAGFDRSDKLEGVMFVPSVVE
jgi:hypothetical protein